MRPKFTVLMDNYNYGSYIGEAIRSVLGQTFDDFQFVIVDDGSTDDSREVIESFSDPRITAIWKSNGGQASAFRAGFVRAEGDYIAFLDSDDCWDPNKLERCDRILSEHPDILLLNHSYRPIDSSGKPSGPPYEFKRSGRYDIVPELRVGRVDFSLVPTSFAVARRRECIEIPVQDQEWRVAADTPILVALATSGRVYNLPETLGSYRLHGKNLWDGRFSDAVLYGHYRRIYSLAQDELVRQGRTETFRFGRSDFAMSYEISKSRWYLPKGMYKRLRRIAIRCARSGQQQAGK